MTDSPLCMSSAHCVFYPVCSNLVISSENIAHTLCNGVNFLVSPRSLADSIENDPPLFLTVLTYISLPNFDYMCCV